MGSCLYFLQCWTIQDPSSAGAKEECRPPGDTSIVGRHCDIDGAGAISSSDGIGGGQQEAGAREASTMVVGQPAMIMVPTATIVQADSSTARVVQTERASMTPMMGVA
jgi:hypothetical protein